MTIHEITRSDHSITSVLSLKLSLDQIFIVCERSIAGVSVLPYVIFRTFCYLCVSSLPPVRVRGGKKTNSSVCHLQTNNNSIIAGSHHRMMNNLVVLAVLCMCLVGFATAAASAVPAYRKQIFGQCWTQTNCTRPLFVMHGGDWNLKYPYDSFPAMQKAYQLGADAVKGKIISPTPACFVFKGSCPFIIVVYGLSAFSSSLVSCR